MSLHQPSWILTWSSAPAPLHVDPGTLRLVVASVRKGVTLEETETLTGMTRKELFDLVSAVGARCTQIGKKHVRPAAVHASTAGLPAEVQDTPDGPVIYAASGWVRPRREGDIRRSYAAVLLAEEHILDAAIGRVLDAANASIPTSYTHFSDLYGASRGVLPPLDEVVASPTAAEAYLRTWNLIDGAVTSAVTAVRHLLEHPNPATVSAALQAAWWLIPQPRVLAHWAAACQQAPTAEARMHAERRLNEHLAALRHLAVRKPEKLQPYRLEQLTSTQLRAIAALHGHHPADGAAARSETAFEEFAAAAARARQQMAAEDARGRRDRGAA